MNQYIQATIQSLAGAAITVLLAIALKHPACAWLAILIGEILWILGYCHWWLEDRLVCLGNSKAAIGMLISTEPPGVNHKTFPDWWDTDYSINLLVPNNRPGVQMKDADASPPFGVLMSETADTRGAGLVFTGHQATDPQTGVTSEALHAEFEGAGVRDVLIAHQIALTLSVASLIACIADTVYGTVAMWILLVLAILAQLIGAIAGLFDQGSYKDAGLPSLTVNNSSGLGADILGVAGRWVYDSGHNNEGQGWNEIHPIRKAAKLGKWDGDWPENTHELIVDWEEKTAETSAPLTVYGQQQPENQWVIHPLIDGCSPTDGPPIR